MNTFEALADAVAKFKDAEGEAPSTIEIDETTYKAMMRHKDVFHHLRAGPVKSLDRIMGLRIEIVNCQPTVLRVK